VELGGGKTELLNIGYEFSRDDINALAQTLASAQLSEDEQALLLAIFSAARDHVGVIPAKGPEDAGPTGADLQQQIVDAFIPTEDAKDENFIIQSQGGQERITPVPIKPPPITPTPTPTPTPPLPPQS
jgi:hypothetical protein